MARLDVVVSLSSSAAANRRLYVLAAFLCLTALAGGQANPGYPSFTPQECSQYDCINLQNLNVSLNVPVMSKSGAFPLSLSLTGDNSYVYGSTTGLKSGAIQTPLGTRVNVLGLNGFTTAAAVTISNVTCPSGDGSGLATEYGNWSLTLADGTVHPLPESDYVYYGANCWGTFTDQVADGTGYTVQQLSTTQSNVWDRS